MINTDGVEKDFVVYSTDDADVGVDIDTGVDLIVAFVYKVTILSHYPNICHFSVFKDYKTYITRLFSQMCWNTPDTSSLWRLRQKVVHLVQPRIYSENPAKRTKRKKETEWFSCLTTL